MTEDQLKQSILNKIKKDEVKMTPKQFFFMKWLTLLITSIFFLGIAIYIFAYVTFLFVDNGMMAIPLSTESGLINFIIEVPWSLVVLGLVAIFFFSVTSKTFYRIYKKPLITFFFSILIIIMLSHIIFVETGAMNYIKLQAYREHISLVPGKLLQFRDSQTGTIFSGYVISASSTALIMRDKRDNIFEVVYDNPNSSFDFNKISTGTEINVYGARENDFVRAESIEIIN
jgi:hypothetical protein